jgi:pimeloyl-ACP methyl ester carboxylesterase
MRFIAHVVRAAAFLAGVISASPAGAQQQPNIAMQEFTVASPQPGLGIYVRNKHPTDATSFDQAHTLVFVHGATYPASPAFDLELGGLSWMDYIAQHGYDVYLLDLPGYGRSTRPSQMDAPAADNPPFEDTEQAVADLGAVVAHVLKARGLDKLDVMGWSWGTTIAAGFAAANPDKVNRLVLYAPLWVLQSPPAISAGAGKLGAYRTVTRDAAFKRWMNGVPEDKQADLIPKGWFDQWADAVWATDPVGAKQNPPVVRAPNGVLLDVGRYWREGKPTWDPAKITVPILLVHAEWDHDTPPYMSQTLFPLLTHAPWKQYTVLGEGTHTIVMEKNRMQLFRVVQDFLDTPAPR